MSRDRRAGSAREVDPVVVDSLTVVDATVIALPSSAPSNTVLLGWVVALLAHSRLLLSRHRRLECLDPRLGSVLNSLPRRRTSTTAANRSPRHIDRLPLSAEALGLSRPSYESIRRVTHELRAAQARSNDRPGLAGHQLQTPATRGDRQRPGRNGPTPSQVTQCYKGSTGLRLARRLGRFRSSWRRLASLSAARATAGARGRLRPRPGARRR